VIKNISGRRLQQLYKTAAAPVVVFILYVSEVNIQALLKKY